MLNAVILEDDQVHGDFVVGELQKLGFASVLFRTKNSFDAWLESPERTAAVDLFVLDRRVPLGDGLISNAELDDVGDIVFTQVRNSYPAAFVLVSTGFASVSHSQHVLTHGPMVPSFDPADPEIPLVSLVEKVDGIGFNRTLTRISETLRSIEDVEVLNTRGDIDLNAAHQRLLRRAAIEMGAVSANYTRFSAGLTESFVGSVEFLMLDGSRLTAVVKQTAPKTPDGWKLAASIKSPLAVAAIREPVGHMFGLRAEIQPLASPNPVSLGSIILSDPTAAAQHAVRAVDDLASTESIQTVETLENIIAPFCTWAYFREMLQSHELAVPSKSLAVSSSVGLRHCDLHGENVLLDGSFVRVVDFDNVVRGSALVDVVTLMLSSLSHPDSSVPASAWPSTNEISQSFGSPEFGAKSAIQPWLQSLTLRALELSSSTREYWAVNLGYSVRQLKYPDITGDPEKRSRFIEIARKSVEQISRA